MVMSRSWVTALVVGAVGLVLGLSIGALAWMGGDHGGGSKMDGMAMGSPAGASMQGSAMSSGSMDERAFIEMMVPHHRAAVTMAELAQKKAQHPEVRRLARDIVSSQDKEIAQMGSWYEQWYGRPLSSDASHMGGTGTSGMGMGTGGADMSALETATGARFDRLFLAMMIPHHASALMMAAAVKASDPRPEISALADRIVSAQSAEIGRMQVWRERWYPPLG